MCKRKKKGSQSGLGSKGQGRKKKRQALKPGHSPCAKCGATGEMVFANSCLLPVPSSFRHIFVLQPHLSFASYLHIKKHILLVHNNDTIHELK